VTHDRPTPPRPATYTPESMEMGTLDLGRRPDMEAATEANGSLELPLDDQARAVLAAQERERARLADELHDGVAQALSNLVMHSEIVERQLAADPVAARGELQHMRRLLATELENLRAYIGQLRPPMTASQDLDEALREAAGRLTETTGVPVEVHLRAPAERLDSAARPAVLRVAQEALRNVAKHAAADRAWLHTSLDDDADEWTLEVGDDGRGFDLDAIAGHTDRRHFGLRFMRERSDLLGARLAIDTRPAAGTVVRLTIKSGERRQA
jgi:signal transduction histidine kinase